MAAMNFKMRLIWELQNFFREKTSASRKGSQDENAWALCILSFPALSLNLSPKSNRRVGDSIRVQVEADSDTNRKFDPYEYQILIKPGGLPSSCELIVYLEPERLNVRL